MLLRRANGVTLLLMLALWAQGSTAQQQITPNAFLDRAEGRTLTFTLFGTKTRVGVEQFLSRALTVYAEDNGRCSYGHIELRGPLICFLYDNFPNPENCWMPFEHNGELLVMSRHSFETQQVTEISDTPVMCEAAPLS